MNINIFNQIKNKKLAIGYIIYGKALISGRRLLTRLSRKMNNVFCEEIKIVVKIFTWLYLFQVRQLIFI